MNEQDDARLAGYTPISMSGSFENFPARDQPRSIESALDNMQAEYDALPMTHRRRAVLADMIRRLQDEIDARTPL